MSNNLAAILPVHPTHRDRLDLFRASVLLNSMKLTGALKELTEIIIIVPDNTVIAAESLRQLVEDQVSIRVISELCVFTNAEIAAMVGRNGWLRQQLIKIAATRITDCDWLLMLDSDNVNLRKLDLSGLSSNGRIPTQFGTQFETWKEGSAKVLNTKPPKNSMSVTPAILSRELLMLLQRELSDEVSGWVERLCHSAEQGITWTEYMLYQCMGEKLGIFERLHEESSVLLHRGYWRNTKSTPEYIGEIKKLSPVFLVVQSIRDDYDTMQVFLWENSIPSVYDLNAKSMVSLASGLFKCLRQQKIFAKYNRLRLALELMFEEQSPDEVTADDVVSFLNNLILRENLNGKNVFNSLLEALANDEEVKIANLLHAVCLSEDVKPRLLRYYYRCLLRYGTFTTLVSDVLVRLQEKTLDEETLCFILMEIFNTGHRHWAAIIIYVARANLSSRQMLKICKWRHKDNLV